MNIYHYDATTGAFCFAGVADESPLEPGVFLIPACATTLAPPKVSESQIAVFRDGGWIVETLPVPEPESMPEPIPATPPVELTPVEKLARTGLTVDELRLLLGLD